MEETPSFLMTRHSQSDLEQAFDASAQAAMTAKEEKATKLARGKQAATIWKGKVISYVKRRPWFSYF